MTLVRASVQPGMSKSRQDIVRLAFSKLDRDHSGFLTADDLKGSVRGVALVVGSRMHIHWH